MPILWGILWNDTILVCSQEAKYYTTMIYKHTFVISSDTYDLLLFEWAKHKHSLTHTGKCKYRKVQVIKAKYIIRYVVIHNIITDLTATATWCSYYLTPARN